MHQKYRLRNDGHFVQGEMNDIKKSYHIFLYLILSSVFPQFIGKWYELSWIPENWFPPEYNFQDFVVLYEQFNDTFIRADSYGRSVWKSGLILGLHSTNERRRYKVTPSLIGWAQT